MSLKLRLCFSPRAPRCSLGAGGREGRREPAAASWASAICLGLRAAGAPGSEVSLYRLELGNWIDWGFDSDLQTALFCRIVRDKLARFS